MELFPKFFWKTIFSVIVLPAGLMKVDAQEVVQVDSVLWPVRNGVENLLQGSTAGLRVKSWSGEAGIQSTLNLRGLSMDPTDESTMPMMMVNGVPIVASPSSVTAINPLSYYTPDQIERIEIIKSIDQLAAYGVLAANGAINIVLKEGHTGPLNVTASAFAGTNYLNDFNYRTDAFYDFNTTARREVYRREITHSQQAIIDGGGDFGSYLFGVTNYQDNGAAAETKFTQQSLFLNATYHISNQLKAQFYSNLTLANRKGRYAGEYERGLPRPVLRDEAFFMDDNKNTAQLSSLHLSYQLAPAWSVSSLAGISYEGAKRDFFIPSDVLDGSVRAASAAVKRQLISVNTTVNYRHRFSDRLGLSMTLGNEVRTLDNRITSVDGSRSLEYGGSNFVKVVTGYNAGQTDAWSGHDRENLLSFYGLWNVDFNQDLKVNAALRADASSLYDRKWGFYPAAGASYSFKNTLELPLTVSASVGKTGILSRPEVYRGELTAFGDYFSGNELGIGKLYAAFEDAKSIDVFQVDAGISYAIKDALVLSVNYFDKRYSDFTYRRYLSNIHGLDYRYETGGKLALSGVEVELDGNLIQNDRFQWTANINLASYRNTVEALPEDLGNTSFAYLQALKSGDALTSIIATEGQQAKVIGNSEASLFGGLTNTFRYKGFTLGVGINYALNADVAAESFSSRYTASQVDGVFPLKTAETPYYFVEEDAGGNTVYQGIRSIEDGSFIRLSRAVVSYQLQSLLRGLPIRQAELFVRGDNLLTWSTYSGFNPEENITGIRRIDLSSTGMPLPSSVVLGLKLVL
ncbi:SusC/RagA family TonB-linked outer membrane protein [Parapedobacter defluvii]|uniref:SusC/RagA family TonB-linked outer membrane protein n=1 Tax=Parapedobacter defluvii TaxID=2045106 RepID=A0ABQ1LG64_9SPHI|nr:TonB-dependent receptor plug domain-containing protein [Parapedobacter defluvii]GGC23885.1 SusC/RagA family TonB-linked outer membrane protein [Parapedobacter defluvii]